METNKCLQTEPLGAVCQKHEFRVRERGKEIQPDMKFVSSRNKDSRALSQSPAAVWDTSKISATEQADGTPRETYIKKTTHESKLHFKSAYSLMLDLGVMQETRNVRMAEPDPDDSSVGVRKLVEKRGARQIRSKAKTNAMDKEPQDSIARAAADALLKCNYIERKRSPHAVGSGSRMSLPKPEAKHL